MNILETELYSPELNILKKVRVYLPASYLNSNKNYPVLYMHDGQNLFSNSTNSFGGKTWEVDRVLQSYEEKKVEYIVVGIDNTVLPNERYNEYSPWINSVPMIIKEHNKIVGDIGGKGEKYSNFIINTLKPYIDSMFRTLPDYENTFLAGSSMGAFISLYMALKNPNIFSKIGLFSIATWFAEKELLEFIENKDIPSDMKIYMDMGTKETSCDSIIEFPKIYLDGYEKIKEKIENKIVKENFKSVLDEGAAHNETAWNKRFPIFLDFISK